MDGGRMQLDFSATQDGHFYPHSRDVPTRLLPCLLIGKRTWNWRIASLHHRFCMPRCRGGNGRTNRRTDGPRMGSNVVLELAACGMVGDSMVPRGRPSREQLNRLIPALILSGDCWVEEATCSVGTWAGKGLGYVLVSMFRGTKPPWVLPMMEQEKSRR